MRKVFILLALGCGAWHGDVCLAQANLLNGVAVIVNDRVITYQEVEQALAPDLDVLRNQYARKPEVFQEKALQARKEWVEKLTERELILNEFKNEGYNLPQTVIDDEVERRTREQFGDRLTLMKTLQSQGVTLEQFREQVRENMIIQAMRGQTVNPEKIVISPYKIEMYYLRNREKFQLEDQVKLRMIYLSKSEFPGPEDRLRKVAEEIAAKLEAGAPFGEMAAIYSNDSHRANGGDWGWIERSILREDLADIAFKMNAGELSEIIDVPDGFYLIKVDDVRRAHTRPLSEVRDEIEQTLISAEVDRLRRQWIDRLKKKSFVRYF